MRGGVDQTHTEAETESFPEPSLGGVASVAVALLGEQATFALRSTSTSQGVASVAVALLK